MASLQSERVRVPESIEEINRFFYEKGWGDGLPIIPPTEQRVLRLLQGTKRSPEEVVCLLPPSWAEATVEKIAVNAVMAGCLPEYLPVVMAAIEAMVQPKFNLYAIQTTTHPCAPLLVLNGALRKRLGINCRYGLLGPGTLANAVIGRAIRLVLMNIGGAIPGKVDKATHGQPGKFTYVMGENEEESPWEPLSTERGFAPGQSTVTVHAGEAPHNVSNHCSRSGIGILTTIAGTLASQGNNNIVMQLGEVMVILGPEHARTISQDGFSKKEIRAFLFEKARLPKKAFSIEHQEQRLAHFPEEATVPIVRKPEDFIIVVAGGAGKHSMVVPTFGNTLSVSHAIES